MTNEKKGEIRGGNLYFSKPYAEIKQIEKFYTERQKNELRIWAENSTNSFCLQIRTLKPIDYYGRGSARPMIATVSLDIEQLKEILAYVEKELHKYDVKEEGASPSSTAEAGEWGYTQSERDALASSVDVPITQRKRGV